MFTNSFIHRDTLTNACVDFVLQAIVPGLSWYEQLSIGLLLPAKMKEVSDRAYGILQEAGLTEGDMIKADEIVPRLKDTLFRHKETLDMQIGAHTFSLTQAHLQEIITAAGRAK